ncbi:MAG TPA: hypothetical protein VKP69_20690, partial [Isosphaeraceae bacterium]|nr:hypothetical protein [Isosphaeraceae bacterium]
GTGESSSRSGGSNYLWKKGPKPEVELKLPRSKTARIVTAAASCAAVLGLIICLILMIQPPRPACMTLIGADYATNLMVPHNIFGVEGLRGLEALANRPRRFALLGAKPLRLTRTPLTLDKSEQWDVVIKDLVEKKFSEQTILIALAMHGVSDPEGPYLLPNGASRPEDRLPLKKVIQDLKKLPKEKDKVLILEAAQIPADWRLGMLHNDFARQLEGLEPEVARVEKLWVLSAAGPDERCWASEGLRRTIFSHFLIEGLAGRAAGTDKRVDLDELYRYVRSRVRDWAWTTRGAVQEPVLLPRVDASGHKLSESGLSARAGRVVLVSTGEPPHFEPPPAPDPSRLEQGWKTFQSLAALTPSPAIYTPRQWRAYRAALVRYDELTRAGAVGPAKELEGRLNVLAWNIREGRRLNNLASSAGNSLVFNAVQGGPVDDPSSSKAEFSRLWIAPEANLGKVWQALQGDEAPAGEAKRRPLRARVDDFLISRAAEDPSKNLGPAALRIDRTRGNDTLPTEAHFLRMLDRHLHAKDRGPKFWGPVRQALAVRRLAERAALGVADTGGPFQYSEQVQPWIKSMIEKADDTRRQAEDLLFSTEPNAWGEAEQSLALAGSLYQRAIERAGHVRAALLLRDRVLADLPDYSRWLAHRLPDELNDSLPGIVEKLWDDTHRLVQQLESPGQGSDDGADLDAIKSLVRDIEEALALVQQRFEDQKLEIDRTREPGDWEVANAAAAVAVSHPDFDDLELRRTIWRRLANIGRRDVEDARPDKGTPADPTLAQRDKALRQTM